MAKKIKGRVLLDCALGRANDVVELDEPVAQAHVKAGELDVHPDAVTYALALPQNAPKEAPPSE